MVLARKRGRRSINAALLMQGGPLPPDRCFERETAGGHGPYMDAPGLPSNQFVLV
jgi:hypothetical protein